MHTFSLNAVLLKGGHAEDRCCIDTLAWKNSGSNEIAISDYHYEKQNIPNTHGTGCTLSSAIAAFLARDYDLSAAIDAAGKFLQQALKHADRLKVGKGIGPLNHHDASEY